MNSCNNALVFRTFALSLAVLLLLSGTVQSIAATPAEMQEWLQSHNTKRALHGGVPAVSWSPTVAASAQAYADTCPSGHSNSVYGENLAWASYNMGLSAVVQLWYDEEVLYDYDNPGFSYDTGHFTQIVWKGTLEIGCGHRSGCPGLYSSVWVCQYNPPGNVLGRFAENVFPPGQEDDDNGDDNGNSSVGTTGSFDAKPSLVPIYNLLLKGGH